MSFEYQDSVVDDAFVKLKNKKREEARKKRLG